MAERLNLAVSSISTTEKGLSLLSPRLSTERMLQRARVLRESMAPVFGREHVGLSLHTGRVLDLTYARQQLRQMQLPVSSVDTPAAVTVASEIMGFFGDIAKHTKTKGFGGAVKQELQRIPNRAGWYLTNSGNERLFPPVYDAMWTMEQGPRIVRVGMGEWIDSRRGPELRWHLNSFPNVILAVEMDPYRQTPAEYLERLRQLAATNDTETPVYADIDLGKLGLSRHTFGNTAEIPLPLDFYETFLGDRETRQLVAMTTFDQYVPGDAETHRQLTEGPIDLTRAAAALGKADRQGDLPVDPTIVAEFHPDLYDMIIGTEGVLFMQKLHDAFDAA